MKTDEKSSREVVIMKTDQKSRLENAWSWKQTKSRLAAKKHLGMCDHENLQTCSLENVNMFDSFAVRVIISTYFVPQIAFPMLYLIINQRCFVVLVVLFKKNTCFSGSMLFMRCLCWVVLCFISPCIFYLFLLKAEKKYVLYNHVL